MNIKASLIILFVSSIIFLFGTCVPDEFTKEYNTDVLLEPFLTAPVAYGSLSIEDVLENADSTGLIYMDSTNLMYVAFRENLDEIIAGEWIEVPDQQFVQIYYDYQVSVPAAALGPVGDTIRHYIRRYYPYEQIHNAKIDSVFVKSGFVRCRTRSTVHHKGILISYSDQIKKDGQSYYQETIISDASGNYSDDMRIPIDGYWIYLDNETNPDTSYLVLDFEYYLINSGQDIEAGEYVSITKDFEVVVFDAVYGLVGDWDTVLIQDEVFDFELFEGDFSGAVYFEDPRFKLFVESSLGVPIGINMFDISAYYASTDTRIDLEFVPGANPFIVKAPGMDEIGQTVSTTIQVDKNNSNINELTNSNISQFRFSAGALTNPPGSDTTENFVLDTSRVAVDFEIELPMNLRVEDFTLEDTVELSLSMDDDADFEINALEVTILTENWMPIDIHLQAFLVDSAYNILDSLLTGDNKHILRSGTVTDGLVTIPDEDSVTVTVVSGNFEQVKQTEYIILNATIESTDQGQTPVKIYSHYSIDFRVSIMLDAKLEITSD